MGDISIDDVVNNSKIFNGVASEFEIPGKLPKTNFNIPIPNVKPPANNGDRICDTCNKEDVCMYKGELAQAAKEITQISERVNVFIDTDIRCKKWSGKVSNYRGLAENQKNSMLMSLNKMEDNDDN